MVKWWRLLAVAAAVNQVAGAGIAEAQTVMVRNAPAGSTIELVVNAETVGSATADAGGSTTLTADIFSTRPKKETDANLYFDVCPDVRRVVLVERGEVAQAQEAACNRTESVGLFLIRPISTLVVDLASPIPTVMLRQGSVDLNPQRPSTPIATGLVVFGGAGMGKFRDAILLACGNVQECSGDTWGITFTAGADFWISRFIGAEVSYVRRSELDINGSGSTFEFNSSLDTHVTTVAGKVGIPMGPVRAYGKAGGNYLRATTGTTQTIDDTTVTIDGIEETVEGGTVTSEIKFSGWGWTFGGGVEAWLRPSFAIYTEGGLIGLKGSPREDVEGAVDDRLTYIMVGARVRIGG